MLEALFFFLMKAAILIVLAAMVLVPFFLSLGFIVCVPLYVLGKVLVFFFGDDDEEGEDVPEVVIRLEIETR